MDHDQLRSKLEAEKQRLTEELSSIAVRDKETPGDWDAVREADPGATGVSEDVADELEDMNERKATETTLEKQLVKVDLALKKMTEGNYGTCEIGGETIEGDRLEANPAARTCMAHMGEEDSLPL
jgi:RNA polymerase-binding transcription factor DksA